MADTGYIYDFEIGSDTSDLSNLFALTPPVHYPKTAWHPYAGVKDLDDNSQRGVGLPSVTWHWATITQAERDKLRTYCCDSASAALASADVAIKTRTNEDSSDFKTYLAKMIWPSLEEEYDAKTRQDFSITFRQMVVTPSS